MSAVKSEFDQAIQWSRQAQQLYYKPDYVLTEAKLLKRTNRRLEARTVIEKGIIEAQKRKVDFQDLKTALSSL